jgi:twitching motility two-component system response regulator PilG
MRLEIESNVASLQFLQDQVADHVIGPNKIDVEQTLKKGITAARNGDRLLARTLLLSVTEAENDNVDAWLWLASISDYPEELLGFLSKVLKYDPQNERACQWETATRSLLAKTFVQRGITANSDGREDFAAECFERALGYDVRCESAWFWKSSLAATDAEREVYLERVLDINPDNHDAKTALSLIRETKGSAELNNARIAAFAGSRAEAEAIVDELLNRDPENADAWLMRSQLAVSFEEKLEAYLRVTELDPDNVFARAGHDYLSAARASLAGPATTATFVEPVPPLLTAEHSFVVEPLVETVSSKPEVAEPIPLEPANFAPEFTPITLRYDDAARETNANELPYDLETQELVALPESNAPETYFPFAEATPASDDYIDEPQAVAHFEVEAVIAPEVQWPHESVSVTEVDANPFAISEFNSTLAPNDPFESKIHSETSAFAGAPANDAAHDEVQPVVSSIWSAEQQSTVNCAFCGGANEPNVFVCGVCRAHLSLSDIESLFGESNADSEKILEAVTQMEAEWNFREFTEGELTTLGLGHFNLKNFDKGLSYLQQASRLNPNNVILASQANALAIRLEDLRRQEEYHESLPKGKTILVVDDSATVRKLISSKLEKCGHHVLTAVDGIEAIDVIENVVPDLVLLDIAMPRMDGYSVCKVIRAKESVKNVPVVMISGKDGFFDKVRGRMAGTTGYITKPFGPETLMRALDTYLLPDETPD